MNSRGVFDLVPKAQIKRIGAKVKETKVRYMVTTTVRVIKVTPMDGGDSMVRVEDILHKMMRRFDSIDDHIKELRSDLAGIGKKVDTNAISIK